MKRCGDAFHVCAVEVAEARTMRALVLRKRLRHNGVVAQRDAREGLYVVRAGKFVERHPFPLAAARAFIRMAGGTLRPVAESGYRRATA